MAKIRLQVFLIAAIALIPVVMALQLLAPGVEFQRSRPDGAQIAFRADHAMVAAPGGCVMVFWQVDGIQAVYINGVPTVGEGFQRICVDETTMPVLRVAFADNTASEYQLNIDFLSEQPSTWLLVGAAVLLGLASLYLAAVRPSVSPARANAERTPRLTTFFAAIGLSAIALVATLALLEVGLRLYFTHLGSELERIAYIYSRAEIDAHTASILPLPFVEYGLSPNYPDHNQLGYRGAEIEIPKPPGVFRIVALGGSTTYGTTTPVDETYPYYLQQVLREDYGYQNVEVVNGGVAGYTSWNILVNLALRIPVLEPDLVIFYEGTNDVLPRETSPDCYSAPSPFLGLDPRRQVRAASEELSPFALYRFVAIKLGWMGNPATLEGESTGSEIDCGEHAVSMAADNVAANPPIYFERNERDMIAVAHANGFRIMFASWAYDHNSADALPFWRDAVAEHNTITERVARESGALYFDYAAVAPSTDDSYWSDYVHMDARGNLNQAQAFAKFLDDQQVIPASPD